MLNDISPFKPFQCEKIYDKDYLKQSISSFFFDGSYEKLSTTQMVSDITYPINCPPSLIIYVADYVSHLQVIQLVPP